MIVTITLGVNQNRVTKKAAQAISEAPYFTAEQWNSLKGYAMVCENGLLADTNADKVAADWPIAVGAAAT